ncbi:MAG: beta-N-acetylglucosaminidase domain-containing protein [Alistipes sp.]|nr:beta-N-acetylglucosaminidase domain-containing protein [Alistipes sp.]
MMKRLRNILLVVAVLTAAAATATAQDLSSQRGESQSLGELLGARLDHGGMPINPTPQRMTRLDGAVDVSAGVALRGKAKHFAEEIDFVAHNAQGTVLYIDYGAKVAQRNSVEPRSGAYALLISKSSIAIAAYDEVGAFYGVQTLRQIAESSVAGDGKLPAVEIYDYPDLQYRGVVEGFYGTPWSHEVRMSLIDLYGRYKMNYYIYGPKDDPYHSSPYWREPYPEKEASDIRELVEACKRNRVNFVWAIHPGQDIQWNEEDYNNLLRKFEDMYALGVRAFAIHFDDISGIGANPLKQTELMNRLNDEFVATKGDVASLIVCPTDYTRLWANPTERGSLVRYGETLHASVDVFWTGDAVCSDLTERTMEWVNSRIKRPALYWWNYPVTDYARHIIMQGPVYGLATTMTADKVRGVVSNPMEHGEASKLALYSVADYTWNTEAYNPIDSWERAIESLAPEVKTAYRIFAIHSCDTETGYRRYESWETETFDIEEYTPELSAALMEELKRIEAVPAQMEQMHNKALLEELRPWLVEFGKLGTRCRKALELLDRYHSTTSNQRWSGFWEAYVDNLMSEEDVAAFDAHRVGTMKLHPFYERVMDGLAALYYESLTGCKSSTLAPFGNYNSLLAPQAKYMFDNDPETYYHSGQGQRTDDFVGADMGIVREVREVRIIQGRNSVDDVDYFDHAILEYSADGETWTALTEPMVGVYDVEWSGEPFMARYVRLRKLESEKTNWLAIRSFEINPVTADRFAEDENPFTMRAVEGDVRFDVKADAATCTLLLGDIAKSAYCRVVNAAGEVVYEQDILSPYVTFSLRGTDAVALELSGVQSIYEVVYLNE